LTRLTRRTLLIGGGAGIGLVVAFWLWPRELGSALVAEPGEQVLGHYLKVAEDGQVTVAVPQAETGQGIWTGLAQIVADELGAAFENVAIVPAPDSPVYANSLRDGRVTAFATSVRAFHGPLRQAGATARDLLVRAAADRWNVAAAECTAADGFVTHEGKRLGFGAVAAAAAGLRPRTDVPLRRWGAGGLVGKPLPRLDLPAKSDGSMRFAGDIRLPGMVFAAVRMAPPGGVLKGFSRATAERHPGFKRLVVTEKWLAAVGETWWAAEQALADAQPRFTGRADADDKAIGESLDRALASGAAERLVDQGDFDAAVGSARALGATYRIAPANHFSLEPLTATARLTDGRLEVWAPVQDYDSAHRAAADAAGMKRGDVVLYPMPVGDGGGRAMDADAIPIAVELARRLQSPVHLTASANVSQNQDRLRPPLAARMAALPSASGAIEAWSARLVTARGVALPGAAPPYAIPSVRVDRVDTDLPIDAGYMRGGGDALTGFATESFVDEMARALNADPLGFRMAMLGANIRLAKVLTAVTAIGGWDGGAPGSTMGIAAASAFGSHVALLVEAGIGPEQRVTVARMIAAVDCGQIVNPGLVRQQIEGSLLHALDLATTPAPEVIAGLPVARPLGALGLRRLGAMPRIEVELIASSEAPGGVSGLGHAVCAAAVANALAAGTGRRLRVLPFDVMAVG
jgi:isoquinoline 1-oxidoreductase beta subunit